MTRQHNHNFSFYVGIKFKILVRNKAYVPVAVALHNNTCVIKAVREKQHRNHRMPRFMYRNRVQPLFVGKRIAFRRPKLQSVDNYPYVIVGIDKAMRYYITFGSDNETFGYHSAKDWFDYLQLWKKDLMNPVVVTEKLRQTKSE